MSPRKILLSLLLALLFAVGISFPPALPPRIGTIDFRAYWTASYLLVHGQNSGDPALVFEVERERTGWQEDYAMMTWNPPWLLILLAPYTTVPFLQAVWFWLLTNLALVFVSALALWNTTARTSVARARLWIPILAAFTYSITLLALIAGQVNPLVLTGLAGALFFSRRNEALAGASLTLTLVKPHLVYLTLPLILLNWARQRRWLALAGFAAAVLLVTLAALLLRPTYFADYSMAVGGGSLLEYITPTLGGLVEASTGWPGFKLVGLLLLPASIALWWRMGRAWDGRTLLDLSLLVSLLTAPFGWSYDWIILLVPLLRLLAWVADGDLSPAEGRAIVTPLCLADALSFYQRLLSPPEVAFYWTPLLIAALYLFALLRVRSRVPARFLPVTLAPL